MESALYAVVLSAVAVQQAQECSIRFLRPVAWLANLTFPQPVNRELAYQITQQIEALGSTIGARCATIVGGMDMMSQSIALSKRPHVVVATPGRLQDHLENTKGFSLRGLQYLVSDGRYLPVSCLLLTRFARASFVYFLGP